MPFVRERSTTGGRSRWRLAAPFLGLLCASATHLVRPDTRWFDTEGRRIEAHGAGMLQAPSDSRWYWYGESPKGEALSEHGVNCYSADTIAGPWKFEGRALRQKDILLPGVRGPYVVERPKVLYNNHTQKFVMWFHLDNAGYSLRHAGVAQSASPTGPFEFMHALLPDGFKSLDMSLFQDPIDLQAYFIRSVDNAYVGISRLTSDYLNSSGMISTHSVFEGMALFRHLNGTYFMLASHLTGWEPNPMMLLRAKGATLDDPRWEDLGNPTGHPTSFNSQPTFVVQITPAMGQPYWMYMGDDWLYCSDANGTEAQLRDACYVWLPIELGGEGLRLEWREEWDLDDPLASPALPFNGRPPAAGAVRWLAGGAGFGVGCAVAGIVAFVAWRRRTAGPHYLSLLGERPPSSAEPVT